MAIKVGSRGPKDARILIVGEAPGADEEILGQPFVGSSGQELSRIIKQAGLNEKECRFTNVVKWRPPGNEMSAWITDKKTIGEKSGWDFKDGRYADPRVFEGRMELLQEIEEVKPEVVIGLGNTALWALAGQWGISAWRGSELRLESGIPFVPTLHPAAILRNWAQRGYVVHDLGYRVKRRLDHGFLVPDFNFNWAPTFDEVMAWLDSAEGDMAGDIETADGHIICLGLATSATKALCIPFRNAAGVYWSEEDRQAIVAKVRWLAESGRVKWIGQNWNYDAQYFDEEWGWTVMADFDTYIAQSVLFPGVERGLGFLGSMYLDWHQYWKDDAKDWGKVADFDGFFRYNCRDACHTWEIAQRLKEKVEAARLTAQFEDRMRYNSYVYRMMRRGVNRGIKRTEVMVTEVKEAIQERELWMQEELGRPVAKVEGTKKNPKVVHLFNSPKQCADLFYKELGAKAQRGKNKQISTDDEALTKVKDGYAPDHKTHKMAQAILECRSLDKIRSTFLEAPLDPDGRFRSSWMTTGTETFRMSSGKNAFHRGGPLQNITTGSTGSGRKLPNLRNTIIPDPGFIYFNTDLERADLQVVAWEGEDEELKAILREGADIHTENAKTALGLDRAPTYDERQKGKKFVHLTNYGGKGMTCARALGCTVHEAEMVQKRWFEAHPGIKKWHERTQALLLGTRTVYNKFGYRRVYFDRVDGLLPEALAWVPQSTVSILISLQHMAIEDALGEDTCQIQMQVHDSLNGQLRLGVPAEVEEAFRVYREASRIAVPYPDPLYIPLELSVSPDSWGEVEKVGWPETGETPWGGWSVLSNTTGTGKHLPK